MGAAGGAPRWRRGGGASREPPPDGTGTRGGGNGNGAMEGGGELGTDGMDTLTELGDELTLGDIDGGCAATGYGGTGGVP